MQHGLIVPTLVQCGDSAVAPDWALNEPLAAGFCRVYFIREPGIRFEDEFEQTALLPNTLYFLPSAHPYRAWVAPLSKPACVFLHVDFAPIIVSRLLGLPIREDSALERYLQLIETCIRHRDADMVRAVLPGLAQIIADMPEITRPSGFLNIAHDYIREHLDEDITLQKLSELTNYHPNYLIRLFREESGLTPHQYILQIRMQRARTMLLSGCRVGEVARAVGYADAVSFARAFRVFHGKTPREYAGYRELP